MVLTKKEIVCAVRDIAPTLSKRDRFLLLGRIHEILDPDEQTSLFSETKTDVVDSTTATTSITPVSFNLEQSGDGRASENRPSTPRIVEGKLGDQVYRIALPAVGAWDNGCLLLCAHGHRSDGHGLVAELDERERHYAELLEDGWAVAATSYRREGVLTTDAVEDLCQLQAHVWERFGATANDERAREAAVDRARESFERRCARRRGPEALALARRSADRTPYCRVPGLPVLTLLEGCSMGGAIVTMAVERRPERFAGAVGLGAAIVLPEDGEDWGGGLTHEPRRPILHACNEGDVGLSALRAYCDRVMVRKREELRRLKDDAFEGHRRRREDGDDDEIVPPALWTVDRPGHVFVSEDERARAVGFLLDWLRFGTNVTGRARTVLEPPRLREHGWARVVAIDVHGYFSLDVQEADLRVLGIRHGRDFSLTTTKNTSSTDQRRDENDVGSDAAQPPRGRCGRTVRATLTDYYSVGLPDMAWKGVITPQGTLRISRKSYRFSNPAAELGVVVGAFVFLKRKETNENIGKVSAANGFEALFAKRKQIKTIPATRSGERSVKNQEMTDN